MANKTIIVRNRSNAVQVLKAMGVQPIRLFPGYNQVDELSFKRCIKDNLAAQGVLSECLSVGDDATDEQREEAARSKAKNDKLNKARQVIKITNEKLADATDKVDTLEKLVKDQAATIEMMQAQIAQLSTPAPKGK